MKVAGCPVTYGPSNIPQSKPDLSIEDHDAGQEAACGVHKIRHCMAMLHQIRASNHAVLARAATSMRPIVETAATISGAGKMPTVWGVPELLAANGFVTELIA